MFHISGLMMVMIDILLQNATVSVETCCKKVTDNIMHNKQKHSKSLSELTVPKTKQIITFAQSKCFQILQTK